MFDCAGLSPERVASAFRAAARPLGAFQQEIDAAFDIRMPVLVEVQFGNVPEDQTGRQFVAQIMPRMFERGHGLLLLPFRAAAWHADGRVPAVRTDVRVHDLDRQQPRVLGLEPDNFAELLAECLGHP